MPAPRKTRTLKFADGSTFRIGRGTVTLDVAGVCTDPPALVLHINPSGGALELPPTPDGTPQFPLRITADRVADIVSDVNEHRRQAEERTGKPQPFVVVQLPPAIRRLAKHSRHWRAAAPWFRQGRVTGYPGRLPHTAAHTLYVDTTTGESRLWERPDPDRTEPAAAELHTVSRRDAVAWLHANGYAFVPAVLVAPRTTGKGAADDAPPARGATDGG